MANMSRTVTTTEEVSFNGGLGTTESAGNEVEVYVETTNGGSPVFHYYHKAAGGGSAGANTLLGGEGARPWVGSSYSPHSIAAIHYVSKEAITDSAQGSTVRILACPIGQSVGADGSNRVISASFNGYGDAVIGGRDDSPQAAENGRGLIVAKNNGSSEVIAYGNTTFSGFRGYSIGGTLSSPSATQADQAVGFVMGGHDGSSYTLSSRAGITFAASVAWTPTSTPAYISFATTATNSTLRTERMRITSGGDLTLNGSVAQKASGTSWSNPSDKRIKTNVRDYTKGLAEVMRIRPVTYQFNAASGLDTEGSHVGVIAQEIKKVLPDTVSTFRGNLDGVETELLKFDSSEIIWTLINSIKELKAEIDYLKLRS